MDDLVANGPIRAATFFALAFGLMTIGGFATGDLRGGVRWGFGLGVAIGAFAYVFLRPAGASAEPDE
jgi:hypothetical protein